MKNPYDKQPPREEIERSIMGWLQDDEVGSTIKLTTTQVQLLAHHIYYDAFRHSQPSISAESLNKKINTLSQIINEEERELKKSPDDFSLSLPLLSLKSQLSELLNAQPRPSISAEEFLKEKGVKYNDPIMFLGKNGWQGIEIEDLLTEFISRNSQGKEVEISETTHRNLCTCKHLVESYDNFCPNCGARIVWK